MFVTRSTASLLSPGTIVANDPSDPNQVNVYVSGEPTGMVIDGSDVYDMDDPTRVIGHLARVLFGPGTSVELPADRVPAGYDGRIARYIVGSGGTLSIVTDGSDHHHGTLVGLNPTWASWH